jgi:hypothetical protein
MSNGRCQSHYFPLVTEVASRQTALKGDLWVYSTRATEAKGGRFKRIKRKVYTTAALLSYTSYTSYCRHTLSLS